MLWAFLASLALLLPTLGRFRLLDADELTHARVALEAAAQGHWFPLTLGGLPWPEKPPLLIWLSAVTMKLLGPTELAVRLWPALGASLALALAWQWLRRQGSSAWAGLVGILALAFSRDWLYHARFLSMDAWLLAAGLGALLALEDRRYSKAGLWLALAAAVKSWFALAWLLPLGLGVWWAVASEHRRRALLQLTWPAVAVLALWLGASALVYGPGFLAREWQHDLLGRISGAGHPTSAEPAGFYLGWARLFFPLGLSSGAALLGAWLGAPSRVWKERPWAWAFLCLWGLGLLLVRVTVFHYFLPWGVVAALLWLPTLTVAGGWTALLWTAALASTVLAGPSPSVSHGPILVALAVAGLAGWLSQRRPAAPHWVGVAAMLLILPAGVAYWWTPPDPNGPLVAALKEAPSLPEPLKVLGRPTQAPQFYFGKSAEYFEPGKDPLSGKYLDAKSGKWVGY